MYCDKESIPIRNNFQLSKHRGVNHNPCLSLKLLQNTEHSIYTKLIVYSVFDKMCLYQFQNIGLSLYLTLVISVTKQASKKKKKNNFRNPHTRDLNEKNTGC